MSMEAQVSGTGYQVSGKTAPFAARSYNLKPKTYHLPAHRAFTLIETMVAISLLTVAIVAPMLLTVQSLASAAYSRDQVTAFYLAQEAIEQVRQIRDGNILRISQNLANPACDPVTLFCSIPLDEDFAIDATTGTIKTTSDCANIATRPLKTYSGLYGYGDSACASNDPLWKITNFTRTVHASFVGGNPDELRVQVTVSWQTGSYKVRSFTISENLYRWVEDGSAS